LKKIVLTTVAVSAVYSSYFGVVNAQFFDNTPRYVLLNAFVACPPLPSPLPTPPPPPQKILVGQVIDVHYFAIACDVSGSVPVDLSFTLGTNGALDSQANVLPTVRITPPAPTPTPSLTPPPTGTPSPAPSSPTPAPTPNLLPTGAPFFGTRAGTIALSVPGFNSICLRVALAQTQAPMMMGVPYGSCVTFEVIPVPAPVPLQPWLPGLLVLLVGGVAVRWTANQ
jgi:hypothetical protein